MLKRSCAILACAVALAACSGPDTPRTPATAASAPGEFAAAPAVADRAEAGRLAYEKACAGCHEQGTDGAPVTGRAEDWTGRSRLWQAVLVQHAERGYFAMPPRGGDSSLSDAEVQAAAEHMLALTHPQLPSD
jgi:cytochrome c5